MKISRWVGVVGALLVLAGLAAGLPFVYFWNQNRIAAAQNPVVTVPAIAPELPATPELVSGKPVRLIIDSLSLDLPIVDGAYNDQSHTWTLSRDKVHYALPSVLPNNQQGNTLLYGHYRPEVFARLHKIAPGAEVIVETDNGHRLTYHFQESRTVAPTDTEIFAYEGKPQLTIQTCTGAWMQNRQLFHFDLTETQ